MIAFSQSHFSVGFSVWGLIQGFFFVWLRVFWFLHWLVWLGFCLLFVAGLVLFCLKKRKIRITGLLKRKDAQIFGTLLMTPGGLRLALLSGLVLLVSQIIKDRN